MPKEARILLIDDNANKEKDLRYFAERKGHKIVRWAKDLVGAEEALDSIEADRVNVVVLDGNLREESQHGEDGRNILVRLRKRYPEDRVKVVWNSSSPIGEEHALLANIPTVIFDPSELVDVITKL